MLQNIIYIIIIIFILFFISNDKKINDILSKKYIHFLFILLILYFIHLNYNFSIFFIFFIFIVLFFIDTTIYSNIPNIYTINIDEIKERLLLKYKHLKKYLKKIFLENNNNENFTNKKNKNNFEPFKNEITKLKDLYENIKLEIKNL
jgi:hypothetical protein